MHLVVSPWRPMDRQTGGGRASLLLAEGKMVAARGTARHREALLKQGVGLGPQESPLKRRHTCLFGLYHGLALTPPICNS